MGYKDWFVIHSGAVVVHWDIIDLCEKWRAAFVGYFAQKRRLPEK